MSLDSEIALASDLEPCEPLRVERKMNLHGGKLHLRQREPAVWLAAVLMATCTISKTDAYPRLDNLTNASLAINRIGPIPEPSNTHLIDPGRSIGLLQLGDTRQSVLGLFPFKENMDKESKSGRLSKIHWLDLEKKQVQGEITFFLKDDRVFQIASATPRFRTRSGITIYSAPDNLREMYQGLRAYILLNSGGDEVGGRDLVYWVSQDDGIAFEFHYYPKKHRRLVYGVVIFEPHTEFFPRGSFVSSELWRELPPYALEAQADMEGGAPLTR